MRKQTFLVLIMAALGLAQMARSAAWAAPQAGSTTQTAAPGSSASLLDPASLKLQAPAVFNVKFTTTKGDFVVRVTRAWSPRGADRFYNLVQYHFFDGAAFFRVIEGFIVQFGISARPEVSNVWQNANFPDDPVTQSNTRGTLTFATAGPNTRTTQLFINLGNNTNLNSMGFSPFGKVTSGMEVVDKLYSKYGEGGPSGRGPDQGRIQTEGKAYLEKSFPLLDTIKTAVIVPPAPVMR
ncbi:MAG: peptidylprolyl isomerase [Terriglobia bacterium]